MHTAVIIARVLFINLLLLVPPAVADVRIVDGDTIELNGEMIRINGIDAPEYGQSCSRRNGRSWPCGREATVAMAQLIEGKEVNCEVLTRDKYGRSIATCRAGGVDVGAELVRSGNAWAYVRYSHAYIGEEAEARKRRIGIWQDKSVPAWDFRRQKWEKAESSAPKGCAIKGNISKNGRIYHAPWSPWYSRTKISPSKGERWFCNEAEAIAAGWRAPYWW